jgi:uncharacterized protein (TIGR00251 family)
LNGKNVKISVKVTPGARQNNYQQEGDIIKIHLTAPAVDGKANEALIKFLAKYFKVKPAAIEILKGLKSRHKIVNIVGI